MDPNPDVLVQFINLDDITDIDDIEAFFSAQRSDIMDFTDYLSDYIVLHGSHDPYWVTPRLRLNISMIAFGYSDPPRSRRAIVLHGSLLAVVAYIAFVAQNDDPTGLLPIFRQRISGFCPNRIGYCHAERVAEPTQHGADEANLHGEDFLSGQVALPWATARFIVCLPTGSHLEIYDCFISSSTTM